MDNEFTELLVEVDNDATALLVVTLAVESEFTELLVEVDNDAIELCVTLKPEYN